MFFSLLLLGGLSPAKTLTVPLLAPDGCGMHYKSDVVYRVGVGARLSVTEQRAAVEELSNFVDVTNLCAKDNPKRYSMWY